MLTKVELETLRVQLSNELAGIIVKAHASIDAEIIHLCAHLDDDSVAESLANPLTDMTGWKKTVKFDLDLRAVEVLFALQRLKANKYGTCAACGAELSFEELHPSPWERYCTQCRTDTASVASN